MIVYRDTDFEVHTGLFTGLKLVDRRHAIKIVPDRKLRDLLNLTWPKVRKSKTAEAKLFRRFCEAASEPVSIQAAIFSRFTPDDLVRDILNEIDREAEDRLATWMKELEAPASKPGDI